MLPFEIDDLVSPSGSSSNRGNGASPSDGEEGGSSSDGEGGDGGGVGRPEEEEWALQDGGEALRRGVAALESLRAARQHCDTLLTAGDGAEVPAHRALLAAASPYLLRALPPVGEGMLRCRVPGVGGAALGALVQWAYTGRLSARGAAGARRLYAAAWALRLEAARAPLADRLLRRLTPDDALRARALPDLPQRHQDALDAYITEHFDEICSRGALSAVPVLRVELVAASSAAGGGEAAHAVAEAALRWLRARHGGTPLGELCARDHLVFVDGGGALRDCDELPAAQCGDRVIREYRAAAAERGGAAVTTGAGGGSESGDGDEGDGELVLGGRAVKGEWRVVAARGGGGGGGVTRALLLLGGRLAGARVAWRDVGGGVARGGPLGGAREAAQGGERRAPLGPGPAGDGGDGGRAGMGAAALGGRLLVLGGYDRARVLRDAQAYEPAANRWLPLPPLRTARARFPAVTVGSQLYALGGSDGHNELDSVDIYEEDASGAGRWRAGPRLPRAVSLSGACGDGRGGLWLVGGWGGGRPLRDSLVLRAGASEWRRGPALGTARSQLCAVQWEGALWALGGCDAWHCLAGTERLSLGGERDAGEAWQPGPALPVARRSVGGAAWRGSLWAAGGSDGACSLAACCRLPPAGHAAAAATAAAAWLPAPSLRRPRAAPALLPLAGALYAVGGFDGKEFLSTVECLYAEEGEWTSLVTPPPLPSAAPAGPPPSAPSDKAAEQEEPASTPAPSPAVNGDGGH